MDIGDLVKQVKEEWFQTSDPHGQLLYFLILTAHTQRWMAVLMLILSSHTDLHSFREEWVSVTKAGRLEMYRRTHTQKEIEEWIWICIILYIGFPFFKEMLMFCTLCCIFFERSALEMLMHIFPALWTLRQMNWESERAREWVRESERACSQTMWIYETQSHSAPLRVVMVSGL